MLAENISKLYLTVEKNAIFLYFFYFSQNKSIAVSCAAVVRSKRQYPQAFINHAGPSIAASICVLSVPFLPRDAMLSAVYAVIVCLCVCLSHSGIVSKRLNIGSRK